jgi:hypothetical protein
MVSRLDPDEEAALSVATLEDIFTAFFYDLFILWCLGWTQMKRLPCPWPHWRTSWPLPLTFWFLLLIYSMVSRLDPDEEAALSVATLKDIMALADILFGFYDLFILWCLGWTLTKRLPCP